MHTYLEELKIICARIRIDTLALARILEILEEDTFQPNLANAVGLFEASCADLDFAIEDLKEQAADEPAS